MNREFEGKTEQDAIDAAVEALHIEREDFDVEIIDDGKRGLFKRGNVKIRVHVDTADIDEEKDVLYAGDLEEKESDYAEDVEEESLEIDEEFESKVCDFLNGVVKRKGFYGKASVTGHRGRKVLIDVSGEDSSMIIGRRGKNLEALQILANVFAGNIDERRKIIVDCESYRRRHEDQIVDNALKTAFFVKKTGRSRLLEPMNPYERRLVHTALNDITGIEAKSEGSGIIKRIRIIARRRY